MQARLGNQITTGPDGGSSTHVDRKVHVECDCDRTACSDFISPPIFGDIVGRPAIARPRIAIQRAPSPRMDQAYDSTGPGGIGNLGNKILRTAPKPQPSGTRQPVLHNERSASDQKVTPKQFESIGIRFASKHRLGSRNKECLHPQTSLWYQVFDRCAV